ncbi:nucleotidyltransferase family protein [Roseibium salinum]|nr:nucleotidyltransferase family protein [Roseibium salinum]
MSIALPGSPESDSLTHSCTRLFHDRSCALARPLPPRLGDPYAASETDRIARLEEILLTVPHVMRILEAIRSMDLPDAWLVSGGIYQTVWNVMTGRPHFHGMKDFDVIYFAGTDLSYEAEDAVITRVNALLPDLASLLEVRNQARVHLWYEQRFGRPYRPLDCSMDSLTTYAARTHAVAARLDRQGRLVVNAPFGLANLFLACGLCLITGSRTGKPTWRRPGA